MYSDGSFSTSFVCWRAGRAGARGAAAGGVYINYVPKTKRRKLKFIMFLKAGTVYPIIY